EAEGGRRRRKHDDVLHASDATTRSTHPLTPRSRLAARTPVRSAAADPRLADRAAAARAGLTFAIVHEELALHASAAASRVAIVVDGRPAKRDRPEQRVHHGAMEQLRRGWSERAGEAKWVDPRAEQRLVRVDV